MHALAVIAAELAKESESSKVPFYILGGACAVWAVVLSAIGLTRPDFPGESARARMVMGFSALLVAGAMVTAVITS